MSLIAERRDEAVALRDRGLRYREIAERMGISISYAQQLVTDPTGEQTRRRKMQRNCVDCGKLIRSDAPSRNAQLRCLDCQRRWQQENAKWTKKAIIEAIHRWTELYGKQPRASQWNSAVGLNEHYRDGDWPAWNTVAAMFGSWNKGIEAAGFEPYAMGGHPRTPSTPQELAETAALVEQVGLETAATELGLTMAGVRRRLQKHEGRTPDMSAPLTAQQVIDREVEKADYRIERLRAEVEALEEQKTELLKAKAVLNGGTKAA
jgi:hypothetical protein